jgi:hypothetical protein
MQIILNDDEGDRMIECPHCHWSGSSSGVKKGDYLELSNITEIFCPACDKYLGFIQHEQEHQEDPQT